jgi:hypothetical protein
VKNKPNSETMRSSRKYVIVICLSFLALSLSATRALAQIPSISWLYMDELARTLYIHGSNFGTQTGGVHVNNFSRPALSWSDTLATCSMPDSGDGYAGGVILANRFGSSKERVLSSIKVKVRYTHGEFSGSPFIQNDYQCTFHLCLRLDLLNSEDIHPDRWKTGATESRMSTAYESMSGHSQVDAQRNNVPTNSQGGGQALWEHPDSLHSAWFSVHAYQSRRKQIYLDALSLEGAQYVTISEVGPPNATTSNWRINESISMQLDSADHAISLDTSVVNYGMFYHTDIAIRDDGSEFRAIANTGKRPGTP